MSQLDFQNFQVDHMTLLVSPKLYNVAHVVFRTIFGVGADAVIYEKRKEWVKGEGEKSMTYAVRLGQAKKDESEMMANTIVAVVQPSEPENQPSHVRRMLNDHQAAAHWQHIALRTPDLLGFHKYALDRGVNFITPILKEGGEDLIQVFSGEWYYPGITASGLFFEFVQRNPSADLIKRLEEHNRESWFRDSTFLGLYGEKEREYQSGTVTPFIDFELFDQIYKLVGEKPLWEIGNDDLQRVEDTMLAYGKKKAS